MPRRKHTPCAACGVLAKCRQLEVMWREAGEGPWLWSSWWSCAGCRAGSLELLSRLAGQLVLWDG